MQINPNQNIQLAALISDTSDLTPYYVQCVMRDTATNKVLGRVNLTRDANNVRRFYGAIAAPSQGNGGRYIDITTTIYSDNAYTVPAAAYGETIEKYLVQTVWNPAIGGAGSGDPFAGEYQRDGVRETIRKEFAYVIEEIGKIGQPTVVVEGKAQQGKGPDTEAIARRLTETVAAALSKKPKKEADKLTPLKDELLTAIEAIKDMPDIREVGTKLKEFEGLVEHIDELKNRLEYIWEHIYMKEMTGDGLPLPAESPKMPRTASDGVMPLSDVMQRHAERRAGFFDNVPPAAGDMEGPLPAMPGTGGRMPSPGVMPAHLTPSNDQIPEGDKPELPPILSDFSFTPSKRKPTEGVVPSHILEHNRKALSLLPTP